MPTTRPAQHPHPYRPDLVAPPGDTLQEFLAVRGMSAREFAKRCGRSAKLIVEILSAKAPIEPETAIQFERVLGMAADLWSGMDAAYRLHLAKIEDERKLVSDVQWASRFPLKEMVRRRWLEPVEGQADAVRALLQFFGVGSVEACHDRFAELAGVSYRHSPAFESAKEPLLVWLRFGEKVAEERDCPDFDRARFLEALRQVRGMTKMPIKEVFPAVQAKCAEAGVVFLIIKPFEGMALSGISRWLTPRRAIIQQTLRHMSNDHFWFTFYHEAAHLLLHSRKTVFLDANGKGTGDPEEEEQANDWAANFLVPSTALHSFIAGGSFSAEDVATFADKQGIAPGIVVGQLQNRRVIPYHRMNKLKERYKWAQ